MNITLQDLGEPADAMFTAFDYSTHCNLSFGDSCNFTRIHRLDSMNPLHIHVPEEVWINIYFLLGIRHVAYVYLFWDVFLFDLLTFFIYFCLQRHNLHTGNLQFRTASLQHIQLSENKIPLMKATNAAEKSEFCSN